MAVWYAPVSQVKAASVWNVMFCVRVHVDAPSELVDAEAITLTAVGVAVSCV